MESKFLGIGLLLGALMAPVAVATPVLDIEHASTQTALREYLIVRPQGHRSGKPIAVARVNLYDVTAGSQILAHGWANFTNDTPIDNVGVSCEIHACEAISCPVYDDSGRLDRIGGLAINGGANITWDRHHDVYYRYGRLPATQHLPVLSVELQCRAYNKNATGNRNWLTVDGAYMDVEVITYE